MMMIRKKFTCRRKAEKRVWKRKHDKHLQPAINHQQILISISTEERKVAEVK